MDARFSEVENFADLPSLFSGAERLVRDIPIGGEEQFDLPDREPWASERVNEFPSVLSSRLLQFWNGSGVDCYGATPDSCMVSGDVRASLKI